MRIRRTDNVHVQHAGELHVIDVITAATNEARIFLPLHAMSHAADLGVRGDTRFVGGDGRFGCDWHGGVLLEAIRKVRAHRTASVGSPAILSAAYRTASTMLL